MNNQNKRNIKKPKAPGIIPNVEVIPLRYINEARTAEVLVKIRFSVPWMMVEKIQSLPEPNNDIKSNIYTFPTPLKASMDSPITTQITIMQGHGAINVFAKELRGNNHMFSKDYYIADPNRTPLVINDSHDSEIICNDHDKNGWFKIRVQAQKMQLLTLKSAIPFYLIRDISEIEKEIEKYNIQDFMPSEDEHDIYVHPTEKWQEITITDEEKTTNLILIKRSKS